MKTNDIRQKFIDYFKAQGHEEVPSSSLIPDNDPTLLFTNAGMNQFKNVFLGLEDRAIKRAASSQKCVRAGGKHNDLENVGFTARHHTFFEMLGNFSFGDYFKKDAIHFHWELFTKEFQIPKDRLYVTVFESDDEAAEIWHKQEGVPKDRIFRFGEKDNFWRMGNTGPCGPCSEIFFDLGEEVGGDPKQNVMGGEGDRYMEIANLVFMQFNETEGGNKTPLPNPSIDTGAGLERLAVVMQGELNNYHTDAFRPIIDHLAQLGKCSYTYNLNGLGGSELKQAEETNVALRVLADHARTTAFLMADGVLPSNEGRGYVLRRIMRRAIRYGRQISTNTLLFPAAVEQVIQNMGSVYGELVQQKNFIVTNTQDEEKRFLKTLDQGTEILNSEIQKLKSKNEKVLSGEFTFKLYDTFGFPIDLTQLMAAEHNLAIDENAFEHQMQKAKEKAKASWKGAALSFDESELVAQTHKLFKEYGPTKFTGYEKTQDQGVVQLILGKSSTLNEGESGLIALDQTCFYAESGGQVGDTGSLSWSAGAQSGSAEVYDCTKSHDIHLLHVKVLEGQLTKGTTCQQKVDTHLRKSIQNNHSATHLLHAALRKVLGDHVTQAGSLVEADRLRFDFSHNQPLSPQEICKIEDMVNLQISRGEKVVARVMDHKKALNEGALALFGEKYGDEVRVIKMGEFSTELCGGIHVESTSQIRLLKIVSEGGVSSGVRRIEALTGDKALEYMMKNTRENLELRQLLGVRSKWMQYLDENTNPVVEIFNEQKEQIKKVEKQLQSAESGKINLEEILKSAKDFEHSGQSARLVLADLDLEDRKVLSEISDRLRDKVQRGIVVVVGKGDPSHPIIVTVSKDLVGPFKAGEILKTVATVMGGKGGGRPDFAQGAAKDRSKINEAFTKASEMVQ